MGEGRSVLGQLGGPRGSPQDPPPAGSAVAPGARVPGRVSGPLLGGGRARVGGWCPPDHDSPVPSGRTQQFVRPRTCFVKRVFLRDASYAERWAARPPSPHGVWAMPSLPRSPWDQPAAELVTTLGGL